MGGISPNKKAATCAECLGWGVLPGTCCRACFTFRNLHEKANAPPASGSSQSAKDIAVCAGCKLYTKPKPPAKPM